MELNYGHLLSVGPTGQIDQNQFQNYSINQNVGSYVFLPFNFGGAMATLKGDNLDATLTFANTNITRAWVKEALDNLWVAKVTTILWNASTGAQESVLYEYFGSCSAGGWNDTGIQVNLNTVLDSVQGYVPGRKLYRNLVGNIPFTANIIV